MIAVQNAIRGSDPELVGLSQIRNLARLVYNGRHGWFHSLHWRDDRWREGMQKMRDEANREAEAMRLELAGLKERSIAASMLADLIGSALAIPDTD